MASLLSSLSASAVAPLNDPGPSPKPARELAPTSGLGLEDSKTSSHTSKLGAESAEKSVQLSNLCVSGPASSLLPSKPIGANASKRVMVLTQPRSGAVDAGTGDLFLILLGSQDVETDSRIAPPN